VPVLKFAAFDILEATLAPKGGSALRAYAHRHQFTYEPRPGYLYVRSRAISSRTNDNFDTFPAEEIKQGYMTFVGKPVFVNHHNENHHRARGVIIDAALHEDRNPDGSPDTWCEVLMEVDAVRFPKLAKAILAGHIDRTSMGTDVAYSLCSFCGNKATTPLEYCNHIPKLKGKRIERRTASGTKESVLVSEICHGLKFFENSLLVEEPADPTAFFTGVEDHSGMGKVAHVEQDRHYDQTGGVYEEAQRRLMAGHHPDQVQHFVRQQVSKGYEPQGDQCASCHGTGCRWCNSTGVVASLQADAAIGWTNECQNCGRQWAGRPNNKNCEGCGGSEITFKPQMAGFDGNGPERGLTRKNRHLVTSPFHKEETCSICQSEKAEQHAKTASLRVQAEMTPSGDAVKDESASTEGDTNVCATCGKPIYLVGDHQTRDWQHDVQGAAGVPHQAIPKKKGAEVPDLHATSSIYLAEREKSKGAKFFEANPVHHQHIVDRVLAATPEEFHAGKHWYSDAHHVAKALGKGDTAKAAGLIGVYSAGTPVAPNYHYASRSLHHNTPVGGPNGVPEHMDSDFHGKPNASASQAAQAKRMLDGEHHSSVLKSPKVSNYSHLIEHGDDEPSHDHGGRVVVDRHAVSAAIDRRITDKEFGDLGLSTHSQVHGIDGNANYHHVAEAYRTATKHLKEHHGIDLKPHQVQAIAWTVQKRFNDEDDEKRVQEDPKGTGGRIQGRQKSQESQRKAWENHYKHLHDNAHMPKNPRLHWGSLYLAFGETKAPEDVDTLRDEECPVCGESDAYDGNRCDVCGFDAPPKMFQDPDLDLAKQLDLRQEMAEDNLADPNGDGMPDVVPGSGQMGSDAIPQNPGAVADPQDVGQQQVNQIMNQQGPLTPEMLDPSGQPMQQQDPLAQAVPQDPNAMPMDPEDIADPSQQMPMDEAGQAEPGTPGDAAADLMCPVCGFQQGAEPPQSVDMNAPPEAAAGAIGALCPNCGQAPLASIQDIDAMTQQMGGGPVPVMPVKAMLDKAFPIITLGALYDESCDTHGRKGCAPCGYGDNDEPNGTHDEKPGPKCDTHGIENHDVCGY
jgi:hypothetical protein